MGQNLVGMAGQTAKSVVSLPGEILQDVVGVQLEQGSQVQQQAPSDDSGQSNPLDDLAKAGFATQGDFDKYKDLSAQKDEIEKRQLAAQLAQEYGLDTGMAKARSEWEQKEEERKKTIEKKEEYKLAELEQKKKQDNIAITAAKAQGGAENKAWGAG